MAREEEMQIDFTDVTMAETDGLFEEVEEIMLGEPPYNDTWMIRTSVTITSSFGIGSMVLHFYGDKTILIDDYDPSINDVYYNPDVAALSQWADDAGWNKPEPSKDTAKRNKEFWKYFWETYLIDSKYFDNIYGKRDVFEGSKVE